MATTRSDDDAEHLSEIDDGCGCAEVWEVLSERREAYTGQRKS